MGDDTGKVTVEEMAGSREGLSVRASSTTRKFQAVVTCVHTPAKFWARIGEAKSLKNFEGYLATLNEWCNLQKGSLSEFPKAKSYIAIKLDGLHWQRAQVLNIINDERVLVFCVDTGVTTEVNVEKICAKQMPILMQQPTQAIQCSLADVTSIGQSNWSKESTKRFKSLVQDHSNPVYVEFQTIKQMGGQMCGEILLFVSDPAVPERLRSVGKILSNEGLAQYTGDDVDDGDVTNKRASCTVERSSAANVNATAIDEEVVNSACAGVAAVYDSESSYDVVVEGSSSEDERPLIGNNSSSNNNMMVNVSGDHVIHEDVAESDQVIGPSHLVENKNSFNIISRMTNYSSSSSSSDEGEDAWDDSLLAPVKPKPASGIMAKADVEKNLQRRKALHAKFNEFLSTPLPPATAVSDRHPFGSRGKRGSRHGAQGVGRYSSSGRGNHPAVTSAWSSDHGNQARGGTQHVRSAPLILSSPALLSSPQQPFPQYQFPQQQFPQQQFPQQQFPQQQPSQQQQFPQRQFPQQQFSQQQFPQQQFPQQQFPQRQFPQRQFPQQQFPHQSQQQQVFQQPHTFPQQQFPGEQLSSSKQDQPWQHSHSPKLNQFLTNKSPNKSTPQVTSSTNTSTSNITCIEQLDEKGMKNEYEWQKWTIERSVKKALEVLSEETVDDFNRQLKKILSDTSATTLNKFPHSKGATWVVVRTVCSQAVDKPVQCIKAVIAVREIYKTCTDEMTRLLPQALQDCSEQVLKEISSTNSQCSSYCNFVCSLHHSTADDNTSLHMLVNSSLEHLLKYWTDYALHVHNSELECGGCANLIIMIFTDVAPCMSTHNRMLLEQCCKSVRSLILSSLAVGARERLLDFYMIVMKYQQCPDTAAENATDSISPLSVDKAIDQTEMSSLKLDHIPPDQYLVKPDQPSLRPDQSSIRPDQSSIRPDQSSIRPYQSSIRPDQSSIRPDQSSIRPDQSSLRPDQSSLRPDQSSIRPDQSSIRPDQSSLRPDQSSIRPDQSSIRPDQSSLRPDQSSFKLDQSSSQCVKPDQGLILPDQFLVKSDQAIDQTSELTPTTLCAPPSFPAVAMATRSHDQGMISMTSGSCNAITAHVDQLSPPIFVLADPYCKVSTMLAALNLSYLLDAFKAAIIQDSVLSCDASGLKEAMKEAGIPSGAVLSIMSYLSKQDIGATRVQYQGHQQPSYYQFPVQHAYPNATAYAMQPAAAHTAYLQQQPHPLVAATQFTSVPSTIAASYQMSSSMPGTSPSHQLSQQVLSPAPPTHPVSLVAGWMDGNKMTQVATGQRP